MLRSGERLGSFVLEEALGQGGMGTVYAAVDERLGRRVAIKVVGASMATPEGRKRLVREARLMAAVEHPGIVPIYELGEHDDEVYIVMELVRGRSLSGLLAELGAPPPEAVAAAGVGIAAAAAAAHEAGILHRDIKPMNVMLRRDGILKVLDFGIAKPVAPGQMTSLTAPGAVTGTPTYLAPELLNGGPATVTTDVWALGVTLAELATGVLPFKARSLVELILSVTTMPAETRAIRSAALREEIDRALRKNPSERPASMLEMIRVLEPLADMAALRSWAEPALRSDRTDAPLDRSAPARPPEPRSTPDQSPPIVTSTKLSGVGPYEQVLDAIAGRLSVLFRDSGPPAATAVPDAADSPPSATAITAASQDGAAWQGVAPSSRWKREAGQGKSNACPADRPSARATAQPGSRISTPPAVPPVAAPPSAAAPPVADAGDGESALRPLTPSVRSGARSLNEDALDEVAGRLPTMPEPLTLLATNVEVARADGDATGVRKRLFELGVGVVRYAVSAGLAVLRARLADKNKKAPAALGAALRKAARMSDGQWADLGRSIAAELRVADPAMQRALKFLADKPLADLVQSRNLFIHGGAHGDDAPERALAVLESAEDLLAIELRLVASLDPPSFEARRGMPIRAGVWRKTKGSMPAEVRPGEAYLLLKESWVPATPWLPLVDGRLLLVDSPHAAGKPWRSMDPDSGEHREHAPLDQALRAFLEADAGAPVPLTDRPALVGRGAVLGALKRASEEALRGGVRVVVLTGPFGIGRSHIAHTVVASATGLGFTLVLHASCSPERKSTLRPLRRALEGAARADRIRDAVDRAISGDVLARREGIESAIEAVEEAIVEASLGEPLLLVVDDAQWADDQTLSLLRLLTERAARGARGQLLVVVTARDEPTPRPALRRLIGQVAQEVGHAALRVALPALPEKDAAQVVRGVAPIEEDIERALVAGAEGVPFFLVQPLLVWSETGMLVWKEKAWGAAQKGILSQAVPGVGELVRARLTSFFDPGSDAERAAQQALACVALYGAGLPLRHVVSAMSAVGTAEAAAEHALEALVEASLLRMDGDRQELRFAQAIVKQALLADLKAKPWFRRVHRALLDAASADGEGEADAAFLAVGYEALGVAAEAVAWLRKGISRAFATGAFADAIELGERLAKVAKAPADRQRGELSVVEALLRLGRAADARAKVEPLLGAALPGTEGAVEARILALSIAFALGNVAQSPDPELVADADVCRSARLGIDARLALATCLRGTRGLALVDEGIRRLDTLSEEQIGDLRYRLLALRFEILWESRGGNLPECHRAAKIAAEAARALGSEWAALDMEANLAALESDAGRDNSAIRLFEEVVRKAGARNFGTLRRQQLVNIAGVKHRAGKYAAAASAAAEAASAAREAGSALLGTAQSIRADALFQLGLMNEAHAAIEEAVELKLAAGDANVAIALLRRAEIHAAMGNAKAAIDDADLAVERAEHAGNHEQALRVRLWAAVLKLKCGASSADVSLRELIGMFDPQTPLPRWTRKLLDEAMKLIED